MTFYYKYLNDSTKEIYAHTSNEKQAEIDGLTLETDKKSVLYRDRLYLENEVEKTEEEKAEDIRAERNLFLVLYIDPVVSNPLRWADMTSEEQKKYADYRRYLLDITDDSDFPNIKVKTFDEFLGF